MKEQCFDEGTMQAFLDGELSSDMLENVARHVAICDDCALLLQESEAESAFAFDILGEEFNTLVPTERIRTNVYQAISLIDKPKVSFWQKLFGFRFLSNPSIVAFASLLIVVGIFGFVLSLRNNPRSIDVANGLNSRPETTNQDSKNNSTLVFVDYKSTPQNAPKPTKIVDKSEPKIQNTIFKVQKPKSQNPKPKSNDFVVPALDGEDTFIKTIATLETSVNAKKDNVLRASSRISYERDMAVIDNSIKQMKDEVRKNPKNEAAKQILRNSYQNKIELLNSVTQRSELMARLD